MLCAGGSISTSTRLSRWALLTGLAFAVPTLGPTIAEAQADMPDAANLYPGRYAAVCTPAPIFGCVCATDSPGEALMFTELDIRADHHLKDGADSEYLRLLAAWPLKARAQQVSHVPRVGVLLAEADNQDMQARLERLRQDLELLNPTP